MWDAYLLAKIIEKKRLSRKALKLFQCIFLS
jgi:hypothetical protein